jgi:hypothetical protein
MEPLALPTDPMKQDHLIRLTTEELIAVAIRVEPTEDDTSQPLISAHLKLVRALARARARSWR